MKLVQQTDITAARFGIEKAIEMIADAGFDAIDLSMFEMVKEGNVLAGDGYKAEVKKILDAANKKGITFEQGHAPFRFKDYFDYDGEVMPLTLRAIEIAGMLGIKILVVHPLHKKDYRRYKHELHDANMKYYRSLIPYCREYGVKVALENMWQKNSLTGYIEDDTCSRPQEFAAWIDEIDSPWITGCLDVGHCGLVGENAADFIRFLGADRIGCLHVHDNDYYRDSHILPGTGKMDWTSITTALKEIGYKGNFTFESDYFIRGFEDRMTADVLKFMENIGRHLIKMIEE